MTDLDRTLVNFVLKECNDSPLSGHLSEDITRENVKTCIWWRMWQKDFSFYCKTCDRFQEENKSTGKILGNIIQIQEPRRPWESVHMDLLAGLPPEGESIYNEFLVIVDSFRKTTIFLPFHKDDTAMDTALMIWNRVLSSNGIFTKRISYKDLKFTLALWTYLNQLFGTKLSFYSTYHPQTDGLAKRMIQTLEDIVKRFSAYVLEFKNCSGLTHDWCALLPSLKLAYKISIHSSTSQTPAVLVKMMESQITTRFLEKIFA
ncbi:hypothetical protein O181_030534 [Austropuccinia psidii MF-1]|uniref:Integrase catalytic domain-containing protein n=1 Tax=Austropuccinia psidii MF-1 TaxID=1389203 RepID=A0A9Q3CU63_9BASI|nr:hypothetical protein [Austropuccinia psidii MF-1]